MRVGQQHPIDRRGIHGQRFPISLAEIVVSLKEAAIDQQFLAFRFQEVFRTCNRAGSAEESYFGHKRHILRVFLEPASISFIESAESAESPGGCLTLSIP